MKAVAAAVAFLLLTPAPTPAQDQGPVARPELKAGDRWTYRLMNYWNNTPVATYEMRVAFIGPTAIQAVNTVQGQTGDTDSTYTLDWNAVSTFFGVYYPDRGYLKFPLSVGGTYKVTYEMVFGTHRNFRVRHDRVARVVGWEEVTVPAGKFRALKIEVPGSFSRLDRSLAGTARTVIWYVPEVKRWVKYTYEDATHFGADNKNGEELVSFQVQ